MVVFGGFARGVRQNSIIAFNFDSSTWEQVQCERGPVPQPRAGHTAVVHQNKMFVFGGKDDENEKLKEFWMFDFDTRTWAQLDCNVPSIASTLRIALVFGSSFFCWLL